MKDPTKVQETIPLEDVPKWVFRQVKNRANEALRCAQNELHHLIMTQRERASPDPVVLEHHIVQTRTLMNDADLMLQDAHAIIAGYNQHLVQEQAGSIESLEEKQQALQTAQAKIADITAALVPSAPLEDTDE